MCVRAAHVMMQLGDGRVLDLAHALAAHSQAQTEIALARRRLAEPALGLEMRERVHQPDRALGDQILE